MIGGSAAALSPRSTRGAPAALRRAAVGVLVAVTLTAAASAAAAGPAPFAPPSTADGVALLQAEKSMVRAQRGDGGLPVAGLAAVHRVNLWGALGLAAANVNARAQATSANSRTLFGLLRTFAAGGQLSDTADLALYLLAAHAVGFTAVRGEQDGVGGTGTHDVVADLLAAQLPGTSPDRGAFQSQRGSGSGDALSTAYAVLALTSLDNFDRWSYAEAAIDWLITHRNGDGSWGPFPGAPGDVETTATVREAFSSVGQDTNIAASRASSWLGLRQGVDGGWSRAGDGMTSDVPATAAVARALLAQDINPNNADNSAGQSPMSFLRNAQDAGGTVGRAPGVPGDEPTQTTAMAMLAFGGTGLLFGPIAGGGDSSELPNQSPPAGLPSGPLLPTETATPTAGTPTTPMPNATTPAPVIQAQTTPPTSLRTGVKRVNARRHGDGSGTTDAGSGSGGDGTIGTAGAPARGGGGGGGSATSAVSAPAATAGAGVPLPTGRTGGKRVKTGRTAAREVSGTLIGRQSPTEGARGSSVAAPGASGAQSGSRTTPWWAIALALAIAAGVVGGIRLDRRRPEVAL